MNFYRIGKFVARNSPAILSVVAGCGVIATAVLSGKGAIKAYEIVGDKKLTTKEYAKETWRCYVPAIVSGTVTLASIVASHKMSKKQILALASACATARKTYKDNEEKIKNFIGQDKYKQIKKEVIEDHAKEDAKDNVEVAQKEGLLFYESYTRQYFRSSIEKVQAAMYHFNRNYILRGYAPINELCDFLDIPKKLGSSGDGIGWSVDLGADWGYEWIDFEMSTTTIDGETCNLIDYMIEPMFMFEV